MLRLPEPRRRCLSACSSISRRREAERRVLAEVGSSSLFGARFRMNAARALLLPRGNPRRRMPLWLQRLKALDLLEAVQEFPSFPIVVETYRDVLQDAFDMTSLARVLDGLSVGSIATAFGRDVAAVAIRLVATARLRDGLALRGRRATRRTACGAAVARSSAAR